MYGEVSGSSRKTWDPNVILDLERRYLLNKAILRVSHAHFLAIKWPGIILSKTEYSHFQPVNWVFTQNPFFRTIAMLKNESLLLKLYGERLREYCLRYFLTNVEKWSFLTMFQKGNFYQFISLCSNILNFVHCILFTKNCPSLEKLGQLKKHGWNVCIRSKNRIPAA